jgi:murein DD-endopeptidase MepM/ murein hydrolase activator NlpD
VARRRDVGIFACGLRLIALACVVPVLVPAAVAAAGRRRSGGEENEHVHVRRGDTLGAILAARGVGAREAQIWVGAAAGVFDVRRLQPRRGVTLRFDRATRTLQAVHYEIDDRSLLVLERTADGIRAARAKLPYFIEVKGAAGRIERGLRDDAAAAGVPPRIVSDLAEIFGWEIDVESALRPGVEFRVVFENAWEAGGARPEPGNVIGAEIVTRGRRLVAVYFEDEDGRGGYYRPSGDPLSREFLRYPVEFTEVTSLLAAAPASDPAPRPHLGVDLAAPIGTPVRAVASGAVNEVGWMNELGHCVRVGHRDALTSLYGHLSRFAAGIRPGAQVERGQIIGYVGSSGLSTGPHLHFAIDRDGEYVDPPRAAGRDGHGDPGEGTPRVRARAGLVTRQLTALAPSGAPRTLSRSTAAFRPE